MLALDLVLAGEKLPALVLAGKHVPTLALVLTRENVAALALTLVLTGENVPILAEASLLASLLLLAAKGPTNSLEI